MISVLGERLKELRITKKLSQTQLAKRANISKASICAYEKGTVIPSAEVIYELCVILDTTSDYLLGLDNVRRMSVEGLKSRQIEILAEIAISFKTKNRER